MVRYLGYRAGEGPRAISRLGWLAHFGREPLYTVDERNDQSVGIIRMTTYDPAEPKPRTYGEAEFRFPEDAEEYRRYVGDLRRREAWRPGVDLKHQLCTAGSTATGAHNRSLARPQTPLATYRDRLILGRAGSSHREDQPKVPGRIRAMSVSERASAYGLAAAVSIMIFTYRNQVVPDAPLWRACRCLRRGTAARYCDPSSGAS